MGCKFWRYSVPGPEWVVVGGVSQGMRLYSCGKVSGCRYRQTQGSGSDSVVIIVFEGFRIFSWTCHAQLDLSSSIYWQDSYNFPGLYQANWPLIVS